jgi:hypothetical protein
VGSGKRKSSGAPARVLVASSCFVAEVGTAQAIDKEHVVRSLTLTANARFMNRKKAEFPVRIPYFVLKSCIFSLGVLAGVALASRLPTTRTATAAANWRSVTNVCRVVF